jgi:hypothetical protein
VFPSALAFPSAPRPTKLLFGTTLGQITAGEVISPEISLLLVDDGGRVVPVSDVPITLTLVLDPESDGVEDRLLGDTRVRAEDGIATFDRLRIRLVGRYKLVATSPGLASVSSTAFTIKAAEASELAFTTQPESGRGNQNIAAGEPFTVTVTAFDEFNNVDTEYQDESLIIRLNKRESRLQPPGNQQPYVFTSGVITFSNRLVTEEDNGYRLLIEGDKLDATSDSFNIRYPDLVFDPQPGNDNSETPPELNPQPIVKIVDENGELITNYRGEIRLDITDPTAPEVRLCQIVEGQQRCGVGVGRDLIGGIADFGLLASGLPSELSIQGLCTTAIPCPVAAQLRATLITDPTLQSTRRTPFANFTVVQQ